DVCFSPEAARQPGVSQAPGDGTIQVQMAPLLDIERQRLVCIPVPDLAKLRPKRLDRLPVTRPIAVEPDSIEMAHWWPAWVIAPGKGMRRHFVQLPAPAS